MKKTYLHQLLIKRIVMFLCIIGSSITYAQSLPLPYEIINSSEYADSEIFIGLVGKINDGENVWMDCSTSTLYPMQKSDNTIQGPIYNGNGGPGLEGKYADCFTRLSEIPNNTIDLPQIYAVRIFIAFEEQLYLYFFGEDGGYSAPALANNADPNQDIRFEMIELTYGPYGLWTNTTRVDAYQYPMGLEVWGTDGFYKKVGEIQSHQEILAAWENRVPSAFQGCYDRELGIIEAPSKTADFQEGGAQSNYFEEYVDAVWDRYSNEDLNLSIGEAGQWQGRVYGDRFIFTNQDGVEGIINGRPNTQEILEAKGVLAEDVLSTPDIHADQNIQKHFSAAFNRGVIDVNAPVGANVEWSNENEFFTQTPFNEYVKFWHSTDISFEGETYAFAYDDVFDFSSTIHTTVPNNVKITIGGFSGAPSCPSTVITPYINANNEGWVSTSNGIITSGQTIKLGPQPNSGGSWSWTGPNGFTESSREVSLTNIQSNQSGNYTATYTNTCGTKSTQIFTLTVNTDTTGGEFIPDPTKSYYIDNPYHNLRIGANGGEEPFSTSTSTTGANVEWKITISPTNGHYYIDCNGGDEKPRIRTNNSAYTDMQRTTSKGSWTKWSFIPAGDNTYFLTTLGSELQRLQMNNLGELKQVTTASADTWERFTLTEVLFSSSLASFHIEAEDYSTMSGIQTETTIDTNGGLNVGYVDATDWMEYTVNIPTDGTYTVDYRVASIPGDGAIQFQVDGNILATTNIPETNGWQNWDTISTTVTLSAGSQTIRLYAPEGGWNLNWLDIYSTSAKTSESINEKEIVSIYPVPVTNQLNISIPQYEAYHSLEIKDINGRTVLSEYNIDSTNITINTGRLSNGMYLLIMRRQGESAEIIKFMK
ncbi:hypothetical protein GCM10022393_23460 [Aquimarina addita]|uniref:Carbohydrate-binding protein n=1 Tax=Aquimarina addita TaxID=870485 RepID=A0ABP6UNW5_9FLAO